MGATNENTQDSEILFSEEVNPRQDNGSFVLPIPKKTIAPKIKGKRFFWVWTRKGIVVEIKLLITRGEDLADSNK